uniref:Uncharacterized protein n=1 Tax=Rhizophora mucronata TaxID=61149 RepID=A0A2P2LU08_RHIMU
MEHQFRKRLRCFGTGCSKEYLPLYKEYLIKLCSLKSNVILHNPWVWLLSSLMYHYMALLYVAQELIWVNPPISKEHLAILLVWLVFNPQNPQCSLPALLTHVQEIRVSFPQK